MTKNKKEKLTFLEKNQVWYNRVSAYLLAASIILSTLVAIGILPLSDSPDTLVFETITRQYNDELYVLSIFNKGKIGHNLRIEISFPLNTSIDQTYNYGGETQIINETFGKGKHDYTIIFSEIQEHENIVIRLMLENSDFNDDETLLISPIKVDIWNKEEGQIETIKNY